jgi:hypothetical protein
VPRGSEIQQRERGAVDGNDHFQERVPIGEALHCRRAGPRIRHAVCEHRGGGEEVEYRGAGREITVSLIPQILQQQGEALRVGCGLLYDRYGGMLFFAQFSKRI